jgi:putative glutamine amidotransferase
MKPFVLLPCDNRVVNEQPSHVLYQRYTDAVRDQSGCVPLPLPTTGKEDLDAYLSLADGILLTGSPANVHPSNFAQAVHDPSLPLDEGRDAITLPLICKAIAMGLPLLAICRGLQEINVAMGGTLHQAVHEVAGRFDHRGSKGKPNVSREHAYAPAHTITIREGSRLHSIVHDTEIMVNSVHGQGIDRLALGLRAEAHASDGQIEAITIDAHPGFNLALQWHPEWRAAENEHSVNLFAAFGDACRAWRQRKAK